MSFNLATMLEEAAKRHPERALLLIDDHAVTFGETCRAARSVGQALLDLGLHRGDRVAVHLANGRELVEVYFGTLAAGLVMVPLNPMLAVPEIAFQVEESGARVIVTGASTHAIVREALGDRQVPIVVTGDGEDGGFAQLRQVEPLRTSCATEPHDTAVVLFTSGTSGRPRGAELTHFQLYMNCTVAGELFDVGPDDVMTAVLPMFHVFGLSSVLNVAVRFGVPLVVLPRFDASDVLDAVERHGITVFSGVPTMFVALLEADSRDRDLSTLRKGISGGAAMPVEIIRGIETRFPGFVVLEGYGLSETASCAAFNIDADNRKVSSVGKPIWGVDMRVVDEAGRPLPPGREHVGEIVVRGHNVMKGYLGRPEATAEALRDGWFHTGDLGHHDEDGYFFISDRLKDLIIRGGYNVYPREVEEVLYAHPDVVEAAVIGRPHERLGEEVTAYVVVRDPQVVTVAALDMHCRERLAGYKYPREYTLVDHLPKGATGKILKRELRAAST